MTERAKRRACAAQLRASAEWVTDGAARLRRLVLAEAMESATHRWPSQRRQDEDEHGGEDRRQQE